MLLAICTAFLVKNVELDVLFDDVLFDVFFSFLSYFRFDSSSILPLAEILLDPFLV